MTKKELIDILANYYKKPKSFFKKESKESLEYLFEEEVLPDILEASK